MTGEVQRALPIRRQSERARRFSHLHRECRAGGIGHQRGRTTVARTSSSDARFWPSEAARPGRVCAVAPDRAQRWPRALRAQREQPVEQRRRSHRRPENRRRRAVRVGGWIERCVRAIDVVRVGDGRLTSEAADIGAPTDRSGRTATCSASSGSPSAKLESLLERLAVRSRHGRLPSHVDDGPARARETRAAGTRAAASSTRPTAVRRDQAFGGMLSALLGSSRSLRVRGTRLSADIGDRVRSSSA